MWQMCVPVPLYVCVCWCVCVCLVIELKFTSVRAAASLESGTKNDVNIVVVVAA